MKRNFPFQVSEPHKMTILEQVLCIVWMSQNYSLKWLRTCQTVDGRQLEKLGKENSTHTERTRKNLAAMLDNLAATVAYQTLGEDSIWMSFIFDPAIYDPDGENL